MVSDNGALSLSSCTVSGPPPLTVSGTLELNGSTINTALDNQGLLVVVGSENVSTINGALTTGASSRLRIEAGASYSCRPTVLTVASGFTNLGTIELTSADDGNTTWCHYSWLVVTGGTLVNAAGAAIHVLGGITGLGNSPDRRLDAELDNQGTLTIDHPLTIDRSGPTGPTHRNSGTITLSGGDLTLNLGDAAASFTNTGTISVPAGRTFTVNSLNYYGYGNGGFNHSGGTLGGGGTLALTGVVASLGAPISLSTLVLNITTANLALDLSTADVRLRLNNATVNGPGRLTNAVGDTLLLNSSTINTALDNQGLLVVVGSENVSTINGALTTGASSRLRIEAGASYSCRPTVLTVASGFTNLGTIELTSADDGNTTWCHYSWLVVTGGTLVNAAGAAIHVLGGITGLGNSPDRRLDAELDNQGTLTIDHPLTMGDLDNRGTLSVGAALTINGDLDNRGTLNVEAALTINHDGASLNSGTITVSGGELTLNQSAGGSLTNTGTLAIDAGRITVNGGTLNHNSGRLGGTGSTVTLISSTLHLGSDLTTAATDLILHSSIVNGPAHLVNASGKTLLLESSLAGCVINAPLDNQGLVVVRYNGNALNGSLTTGPSSVLRVEGEPFSHVTASYLTIANGFVNNGTIELTSVGSTFGAILTVTGGTLENAPGGSINVLRGTGGERGLSAALDNRGTLTVGAPLTFTAPPGSALTNSGIIAVSGGDLTLAQGGLVNTGTASVAGGQLSVGQFSQSGGALLDVALGPVVPLRVGGPAELRGELIIRLAAGFLPSDGERVTAISYASRTGTFDGVQPLGFPSGVSAVVDYGASGLDVLFSGTAALSISSITPRLGGNLGLVTVTVSGSDFSDSATVELLHLPAHLSAQSVSVLSPRILRATFDLTGQPTGPWDLRLSLPDGENVVLPAAFQVLTGAPAQLAFSLNTPVVRANRPATISVRATNIGLQDSEAQFVHFTLVPAATTPDSFLVILGSLSPGGSKLLEFSVPGLPVGASARQTRVARAELALGCYCVGHWGPEIHMDDPGDCSAVCQDIADLENKISDLTSSITAELDYIASDYCRYLCGFTVECQIACNQIDILEQRLADTKKDLSLAQQHVCPLHPCIMMMPRMVSLRHSSPLLGTATGALLECLGSICAVGSFDPNEKVGPVGFAGERYASGRFQYRVYFENAATATAPAQEVTVTDSLDSSLFDLRTVSFENIGISDSLVSVTPLPGLGVDVDLRPHRNVIVRVAGTIDSTGRLTWRFSSLDPVTGQPLTDPLGGFLPPNVDPPEGEAFVSLGLPALVWVESRAVPGREAPLQAPTAGRKGLSLKGSRCGWPESSKRAPDAGRTGSGRPATAAWLVFTA